MQRPMQHPGSVPGSTLGDHRSENISVRELFMKYREHTYLASKVYLGHSDILQSFFCEGHSLDFIFVGVRVAGIRELATPMRMKMARLDDDATNGEDVSTTLIWVYSDGFVAEVNH